ncbi:MAG: hypothetical protein CSB44_00510 [Gammaproteobacteria bacterium]|nr:MAG: hypothetical protein CSB44_00510 [Gammaproteobacteria bacterium]
MDITVGEAPQGAERDMYIELEVADSEPLVNSEVRMTVRVYYDVELIDVDVDAPVADGADILQIGGGRATEAVVDGRRYRVAERDYVLYPNRSGAVTVQPVTLEALVPTDADASNRRGSVVAPVRRVVRMSDALELDVQPRPDDYTGWWLPARELTVSRERADGDGEIRVGEPLTLRTTMRAAGVRDTQFPDLAEPTIDGAVVYGEPPERSTGADENGLRAEATLDWVVIPEREGEIEIPAMTIDWYDIESHEVRVERLPAMRFDVVSATGAKDAAAPVAAPEDGKAAAGAGNDAGPEVSRDASGNPGGVSGDAGSDVPGNANDDMPGNAGGDAATRETAGRSAPPASTIAGSLRGYLVPLLGAALLAAVAALLLQWRRLRGLKVRLDALEAGSTGTAGNASISSGRDDARLEVALKEIERAAAAGDHDALHAMLQVWARRRWEGQTPPRSASRMAALVEREARLADTDDATPWQAITEALRALDRTRYRGKDKAVGEADATQLRALGRLLAALPSRPLTATPEARSVVVSGYHLANW